MAQLPQIKKGYIRGVLGILVTGLNADGTIPGSPTKVGIKTAQEAGVDLTVVDGEAATLKGGNKVLAYVKDADTVVGGKIKVKEARFDAKAIQTIQGGTLVEVVEGADTRIVGWEAPTVAAQQTPPVFQAEVYAQAHGSRGEKEGYLKYTFPFARGKFTGETVADGEWTAPEFEFEFFENPSTTGGSYKKEFVSALPAELQ